MSHHETDYETAAADLGEYYGRPIFYQDKSLAEWVTIENATVHKEKSERRKTDKSNSGRQMNGWQIVRTRIVYIDTDAATIRTDGIVKIGEVQYAVESVGTRSGNQTVIYLRQAAAGEISRPGARGS